MLPSSSTPPTKIVSSSAADTVTGRSASAMHRQSSIAVNRFYGCLPSLFIVLFSS